MHNTPKWTSQEDNLIKQRCEEQKNIGQSVAFFWRQVSRAIKLQTGFRKTQKQCEDRWNNHLRPGIQKPMEWSNSQLQLIFQLQKEYGNRWTLIASKLQDRKETQVKNLFYSTLRKTIRIVNSYIAQNRSKKQYKLLKLFQENTISKIVAQEQGKNQKMRILGNGVDQLAQRILNDLFVIYQQPNFSEKIEEVISLIQDFNRNCRRVKTKKRKNADSDDQDIFEQTISMNIEESREESSSKRSRKAKYVMKMEKAQQTKLSNNIIQEQGLTLPITKKAEENWVELAHLSTKYSEIQKMKNEAEQQVMGIDRNIFNYDSDSPVHENPLISNFLEESYKNQENIVFQFEEGKQENNVPFWNEELKYDAILQLPDFQNFLTRQSGDKYETGQNQTILQQFYGSQSQSAN